MNINLITISDSIIPGVENRASKIVSTFTNDMYFTLSLSLEREEHIGVKRMNYSQNAGFKF